MKRFLYLLKQNKYFKPRKKYNNIIEFKYIDQEDFYNMSRLEDKIYINLFDLLAKEYYDLDFSKSKVRVIDNNFYIQGINRYSGK